MHSDKRIVVINDDFKSENGDMTDSKLLRRMKIPRLRSAPPLAH